MKRIVNRMLITIGILAMVFISISLVIFLKLRTEISKMHPIETKKITDRIYTMRDSLVNVYIIRSDSGYIMIDAGNDIEVIKRELAKLEIDKSEVVAIFLTHTDNDHVASISLFEHADVYLSKEEEQMIDGSQNRLLFQYNKLHTKRYKTFDEGQVFNFPDITVQCIPAPGHTPGATCYLINNHYLFTGDALSLQEGKVHEFIKMANMDQDTHKKSINKISTLKNIKYIFTAHHGMTDDFFYTFSDWQSHD